MKIISDLDSFLPTCRILPNIGRGFHTTGKEIGYANRKSRRVVSCLVFPWGGMKLLTSLHALSFVRLHDKWLSGRRSKDVKKRNCRVMGFEIVQKNLKNVPCRLNPHMLMMKEPLVGRLIREEMNELRAYFFLF